MAYENDEPSLYEELKKKGIEDIYYADPYDIVLSLKEAIEKD